MQVRSILIATAIVAVSAMSPVHAQIAGEGVKTMMGNASDAALDRLGRPGAFSTDEAIRIGLPGAPKQFGDVLKFSDKIGVTNDLTASLNHAAELAAAAAKPIFRSAIDRITLRDMIGIGTHGSTAATDYLKRTSGNEIISRITPLIKSALLEAGAFKETTRLSALGFNEDKLTSYVTQKTSDGIFLYMGREETRMRADPVTTGRTMMKGLKF